MSESVCRNMHEDSGLHQSGSWVQAGRLSFLGKDVEVFQEVCGEVMPWKGRATAGKDAEFA